jgi:ribosomal protein L16 Arg81 hydroxylase
MLAHVGGYDDIAQLIGPQELSSLLDSYFAKRPLVLRANERRGRFSHFYSRAYIKEALNGRRIDLDRVRLVTAKGEFCTQAFLDSHSRTSKALGDRIVEFVEKSGGTFNVSRIYNHSPEVAGLTRTLNRLFKANISASAFYTGARGQAFPTHWDTFDTFIFQVEGKKNWTVYEPMIHAPLPDIHYCTRYDLRKLTPVLEIDLAAGDLMMVPRGYPHRARTKRSNSIHMTVGVHPPTWQDFFLTILSRTLLETRSLESFRSDCHVCNSTRDVRKKYAQNMLNQFVGIARSIIASDYFLDYWAAHAGMDTHDGVHADTPPLHRGTVFLRQGGFCIINRIGDRIHFWYNNKKLVMPSYVSDSLEFIATTPRFGLRDLPAGLTTMGQMVLVKKLCAIGFLLT